MRPNRSRRSNGHVRQDDIAAPIEHKTDTSSDTQEGLKRKAATVVDEQDEDEEDLRPQLKKGLEARMIAVERKLLNEAKGNWTASREGTVDAGTVDQVSGDGSAQAGGK